jgi:hypothetical protein
VINFDTCFFLANEVNVCAYYFIATKTSTTMTTTTTTGVPVWLINPGGELGSLNPWISSSSYAPVLDNGTANGANIPPYNGSFDFSGGPGGGSLNQKVSLTDKFSTTKLDSGLLYASISFWERTSIVSAADTGQVTLIFLSATNTSLSNVTTGPKTCALAWCHVTGNWTLPVGTRTIDYVMTFVANYGSYADAWIDDNSLSVA